MPLEPHHPPVSAPKQNRTRTWGTPGSVPGIPRSVPGYPGRGPGSPTSWTTFRSTYYGTRSIAKGLAAKKIMLLVGPLYFGGSFVTFLPLGKNGLELGGPRDRTPGPVPPGTRLPPPHNPPSHHQPDTRGTVQPMIGTTCSGRRLNVNWHTCNDTAMTDARLTSSSPTG